MDLAALKSKRATIKVPFDGETIVAQILPHKITPEYQAQLQKLSKETEGEEARNANAQLLADMMPEWDVTADGQPYPPTSENLRAVPVALLEVIAATILDYVGKLATPAESSS